MAFDLDTGENLLPLELLPDWFRDQHHGEPDENTMKRYAFYIIGEINRPAKIETARRHLMANMNYLSWAAKHAPGHFDEIMVAYAEKAL